MNQSNDSAEQSKNRRRWSQEGKYAKRSPPWTVSKNYLDGCSLYVVWKDGVKGHLKVCNDFDEAKKWIGENE